LTIVVWLLGLVDLGITMTYLTNIGMFESNPIARAVIGLGSPTLVVAFKLATMVLSTAIVLGLRARWHGEAVALLSVAILGWLTFRWLGYVEFADSTTSAIAVVALDPSQGLGEWVSLR
jgi:hypothetical protein